MSHVADNIVAAVDHPVVTMHNGITRVDFLDALREDRIVKHAAVGRYDAELRHIGENPVHFDMDVTLP